MDNIRIILGSLRYKTATNTDLSIPTPLIQNSKNIDEFDRTVDVNLAQLFDDERQRSTTFRPTCKFQLLYENAYTGSTNYTPLENNLYYINETQSLLQQCTANPDDVIWEGFVQYHEFDFIRSDFDVTGYTQPPNNHVNFVSKSASSYNWNFFVSYPYKNIDKRLCYYNPSFTSVNKYHYWNAVDGIPFLISNTTSNGSNIVQFRCPMKHNLSVGEYVKLNFSYNGTDTFQVYELGDGLPGTDEYIFNIYNIGFTGTTFDDNTKGTFRRVINNENPTDSISKYYVLQHKILTNVEDYVLVNAGFEQNIFGSKRKFESPVYTPNNVKRVSFKEGAQSYTLSFNVDIDINELRDNHKRPLSELYITTVWKGYFGLMFGSQSSLNVDIGLKEGFDFNLPMTNFNEPNEWWDINNTFSNFVDGNNQPYPLENLTPQTTSPINFKYMGSLKSGDILDGGFYEWNDYEQIERLISDINHKFTFNPRVFNIGCCSLCPIKCENQLGYYYKPHNKIKIRAFSDYVETGDVNNIVNVPDYAYFSTTYNSFIWRDIYDYGFKDRVNNGVDYPFLNGKHYPFENFIFRIIPEGTNYIESNLNNYATIYGAAQPTTDDCE